jgi:hypothetical protein
MNTNPEFRVACTEEFAELCALSTSGSLTAEECLLLERHLDRCEECRALVSDYGTMASVGMAKLAADLAPDAELEGAKHDWAQDEARRRILRKLKTGEPTRPILSRSVFRLLQAAAVVLLALVVGYKLGMKVTPTRTNTKVSPQIINPAIEHQLAVARKQLDALNMQVFLDSKTINDLTARSEREEKEVADLGKLNASLNAITKQLSSENEQQGLSLNSVLAEKDAIQSKLKETSQSLQSVSDELSRLREQRQKALLETASLETRIDGLSARLRDSEETAQKQEELLNSDRDIRELMGARQLYIADVFDVDQNGRKRKPFGRVFYTKGKSLIFYAFDLDQQPGYRNAKRFQVWGSPFEDQSKPVNLGVFYMDSEANRRWVFKSDDPGALAQINAVFVTAEPTGESKTPSGKPFLYAYLRSAPANHP